MSTTTFVESSSWKKLDRKINELEKKKYLPADMVAVIGKVARVQLTAMDTIRFDAARENAELPPAVIAETAPPDVHAQGAPLLPLEKFPIDMQVTRELIPAVLHVLRKEAPQLSPTVDELETLLEEDPELVFRACVDSTAIFSSGVCKSVDTDGGPLRIWAQAHPEAPSFLRFVVQSALTPSLVVAGRHIGERHGKGSTWLHGHCPVCGSLPLISRLTGTEGLRMNTCSMCVTEYRVPRIGCPFCLSQEKDGDSYFSSEDEPGYLLDVCNSCNSYMKIADFRQFDRVWLPMLDDLGSLTLDLYARQMKYGRPTLSAWGF